MLSLISKLLLALFGLLMISQEELALLAVTAFLAAIILSSLNSYFLSGRFTIITSFFYFVSASLFPVFYPFLSLFCFDLFESKKPAASVMVFIPLLINLSSLGQMKSTLILLFILLAVLMQYMCKKIACLSFENTQIIHTSIEQKRQLQQQNKNLMERQDYEIHVATLKERNRIAREIHDNVGHTLTRALLQAGALQTLNKNNHLADTLTGLKDTLSQAMDSIRGSVHDIKDDSIDLHDTLTQLFEAADYDLNLNYDVISSVNNNIKYCFITAAKEALTNISKHSDATTICVTVQEHPALYQLLIHDNGSKKPFQQNPGIGLNSMEERVRALNGHFSATYQKGFRIFISIPKQEDHSDDENNNR